MIPIDAKKRPQKGGRPPKSSKQNNQVHMEHNFNLNGEEIPEVMSQLGVAQGILHALSNVRCEGRLKVTIIDGRNKLEGNFFAYTQSDVDSVYSVLQNIDNITFKLAHSFPGIRNVVIDFTQTIQFEW